MCFQWVGERKKALPRVVPSCIINLLSVRSDSLTMARLLHLPARCVVAVMMRQFGSLWEIVRLPRDASLCPVDIEFTLDTLLTAGSDTCMCLIQGVGGERIAPAFSAGDCYEQYPRGGAVDGPAALRQGAPLVAIDSEDFIYDYGLIRGKYTTTKKEQH